MIHCYLVCAFRRQEELEARLVEEETTKRVEELVAKRVQEELERRRDREGGTQEGGRGKEGGWSQGLFPGRPANCSVATTHTSSCDWLAS